MGEFKQSWILLVILLITGCSTASSPGAGGDLPAVGPDPTSDAADNDSESLVGQLFDFEMRTEILGNEVRDKIKTEWTGEFSYDAEGKISGIGVVYYEATIYNVDGNGCGYRWTEKGMYNFDLGGTVRQKDSGNVYAVKIKERSLGESTRSQAEATCKSPGPLNTEILEIYSDLHLKGLFAGVEIYLHRNYEAQIRLCLPVEEYTGNATIYILVCLPAEQLN